MPVNSPASSSSRKTIPTTGARSSALASFTRARVSLSIGDLLPGGGRPRRQDACRRAILVGPELIAFGATCPRDCGQVAAHAAAPAFDSDLYPGRHTEMCVGLGCHSAVSGDRKSGV